MNDRTAEDTLQARDEERAFFRCVELVQMAQRGAKFEREDVQDLMYHLGVTDYFRRQA